MRYLPFTPSPKATTTDAEIIRRRWLFLDIDPTRPVGMSSTDVEKQTAIVLATDIQETLRAGVKPWERLFQNLRASRATELAAEFPAHFAAAWLGHSTLIAQQHYWHVTDADFEKAVSAIPEVRGANNVHQQASTGSDAVHDNLKNIEKNRVFEGRKVTPTGLEPVLPA